MNSLPPRYTLEDLRSRLSYSPETGHFHWLCDQRSCGDRGRVNAKAGDRAGIIGQNGYRFIKVNKDRRPEHRVAWFYFYGEWPSKEVDHINGNKADNRIANLRLAERWQNQGNRPPPRYNTSGFKGAHFNKREQKWVAGITNGAGSRKHLGYFDTAEEAHAAYRKAAIEYFGEFARFE